jgi:hypothetical protein
LEISDDKHMDLLLAPVHEMASFYRLLLGLSTGAVVVFVNLLNAIHVQRWITLVLVLAIICFGAAAGLCLRLLMKHVEFLSLAAEWIRKPVEERQNGEPFQTLLRKSERMADALGFIFAAGVALSGFFVIALWMVRG